MLSKAFLQNVAKNMNNCYCSQYNPVISDKSASAIETIFVAHMFISLQLKIFNCPSAACCNGNPSPPVPLAQISRFYLYQSPLDFSTFLWNFSNYLRNVYF